MRYLLAITCAAVLLLAGCGGASPDIHTAADGTIILLSGSLDGGMDMALTGMLAVGEGSCLGVTQGGGNDTLVVWPAKADVSDEDGPAVKLNGTTYRLGDEVSLGGGMVQPGDDQIPEIPSPCATTEVFLVTN